MLSGQPGFFKPRFVPAFLQPHGAPGALSLYDTSPLRATLEGLVDFKRINAGKTRLSLGAVNIRLGALQKRVVEEARRHAGTVTLIEDAASGITLLQLLPQSVRAIARRPFGDKLVRFSAITPMIESGQVHLPARAPWLDAFKRELLSFPASANDDQVDALSQLLNWLRGRKASMCLQTTYSAFA